MAAMQSGSRLISGALLAAAAALAACGGDSAPTTPARGTQPVPVRVAEVSRENLPVRIKALGTVTPANAVTVRSRIDGELVKLLFKEGQTVKQGQLLAQIDPRPYQVALAQAEGQQQENLVQLQNAEIELTRLQDLVAKNFVSKQQLTTQEALARQHRARTKTDEAVVDNARLQLSYTNITAPIDGRLGLRKVDRGNLIRSGDTEGLVTITQTRPINVVFTIPETELSDVLAATRSGDALVVEAWDRAEREQLATGTLASLDNQIDVATGTLKLKAAFNNDDGRLFPNQFVNVRLKVHVLTDALVIPNASVQYGAQGNYVFVVGDDSTVTVRPVTLGAAAGERIVVTQGLSANERVVLEGLDRLRDGRSVEVIADNDAAGSDTTTAAP